MTDWYKDMVYTADKVGEAENVSLRQVGADRFVKASIDANADDYRLEDVEKDGVKLDAPPPVAYAKKGRYTDDDGFDYSTNEYMEFDPMSKVAAEFVQSDEPTAKGIKKIQKEYPHLPDEYVVRKYRDEMEPQNVDMERWFGTDSDTARTFVGMPVDVAKNAMGVMNDLSSAIGLGGVEDPFAGVEEPESDMMQMGRDIGSYAITFATGMKMLGTMGKTTNLVKGMIAGAGSDFSLSPEEGNISSMITELEGMEESVFKYADSQAIAEEHGNVAGRTASMIEGGIFGGFLIAIAKQIKVVAGGLLMTSLTADSDESKEVGQLYKDADQYIYNKEHQPVKSDEQKDDS